MRVKVDLDGGLQRFMAAEILAGERAVTRAVTEVGSRLQARWRGQVTASGLGARLAQTIRREVYPKQDVSLNAASLIYARPNRGSGASAATVVGAHDEGSVITGKDGLWLAIPIGPVAKMRGPGNKRITPLGWERVTGKALTFIYRPGKPGLLVDTGKASPRRGSDAPGWTAARRRFRKNVWTVIFVLKPQVRLRKRLDLARLASQAEAELPVSIIANWKDP